MYELKEDTQKAILVFTKEYDAEISHDEIVQGELKSLVENIGLEAIAAETFKITKINPAIFLGKGQLERLAEQAKISGADLIVFNTQISPRIQQNLEARLGLCVIDREEVIIQIFADRAQTAEAKLQAELASLRYSLPRLNRKWSALSQQRGGAFHSRGSGETKLELSRRVAKERISVLNKKLAQVQALRSTQRKNRIKSQIKSGSIVGYTNSGKSSLLRLLSKQNIAVADKLFATLDAQTKRIFLPDGSFALLTDTVGFVDKLPHDLIDAFKSTLEEVRYSDFLIIVCDASHPAMLACLDVTVSVLQDLGCDEKRQIIFVNKCDKIYDRAALATLRHNYPNAILASVKEHSGIEELRTAIQNIDVKNVRS